MKKISAVLLGVALTLSFGGLIACKPPKAEPVPGDKNWVDYAHDGSVSLMLDYKGKDFYKDGIGEVKLKSSIDGDTAHFFPVVTTTSSAAIKSRYYGIDTPESTGRIQPWGKEASDFNKKKLKEAAANGTIVISSAQDDYGEPIPDSTGSRYVSLVWINTEKKNARFDELYLLNLEIVEYGYSWVKNVQDMPTYADTFYAAERQAKAYKLALFSGTNGSMDDGDYKDTSLLDLKYATEQYLADPEYQSELDNKRVRVRGTVAGFSGGTMYIQSHFTEEESAAVRGEENAIPGGEYASINIFCGMSAVPSRYRRINTYIELCVTAVYSENFGFQLTGAEGHFPIVASEATDEDCKIILTAEENVDAQQLYVAPYTPAELSTIVENGSFECLNCAVSLTETVTVNKFYINDSNEITLGFEGMKFGAFVTMSYAGDPSKPYNIWKTESDFMGKKFLLSGIYTYHQTQTGKVNYQIIFNDPSGLQWVPDADPGE